MKEHITPEVGDVFYIKPFPMQTVIITNITEYKGIITYTYFNGKNTWETSKTRIKKEWCYLGKSKASMEQLFEVENEDGKVS